MLIFMTKTEYEASEYKEYFHRKHEKERLSYVENSPNVAFIAVLMLDDLTSEHF